MTNNNKKTKLRKTLLTLFVFVAFIPVCLAQTNPATAENSYFGNALFITLLSIIILLLFFIAAIAGVVKKVSFFYIDKEKGKPHSSPSKTGSAILLLFLSLKLSAANADIPQSFIGGIDSFTFYVMISIIAGELLILLILLNTIKTLIANESSKSGVVAQVKPAEKKKTIIETLNDSVGLEQEADILLDHDYDGIKELDNNLPPWWKYGFYLTIVWSIVYMAYYHLSKTGDLQLDEYKKELQLAEEEKAAYMKNTANSVDEGNVKLLSGANDLNAGKEAFLSSCAACHGKLGEGTVGPNLTDEYWMHGGSLVDVFKSVKYGWPDKGMKAWKEDLSPNQIAQISSYIISMKGTNPPNAKAPQGDLYIVKTDSLTSITADSSSLVVDSLKTKLPDEVKNN